MIYGIGCDLCDTARMAKSLGGPHGSTFAARVFGPAEREALGLSEEAPDPLSAHKSASAAADFAAKEAFLKAAGTGLAGPFALCEIEAVRLESGAPEYRFSGGSALTPDGNLTLIDDIGSSSQAGKQFITLESKNGNVFYLIIDRDDDGEETVHFLNQVDEADLEALTEDGETQPAACSCTERCQAGAVNMDCELCAQDMTACVGPEPEPEETETPEQEETEPEAEESSGLNPAVLLLVLALVGGGGAFAYFKLVKNKPKTKGNDDLDDYDYGEDSEDADDTGEDEIWETEDGEPDEDDPDAGGGGDEESETPVK